MSENTLNSKILAMITDWPECDRDELFETLEEYKELAQQEVDGARGERNLQIHNTTRQIYEKQIAIIEEITDSIDDDDTDSDGQVAHLLERLKETLDSGESIG